MNKSLNNTPTYLSGITFGSPNVITIRLGWDYVNDFMDVNPLIHLFDKTGKRLDIISKDKTSSQGLKITLSEGAHYEIELSIRKLPNYIDSIYLSLGSLKAKKSLGGLKDLYVELIQGEESEIWGLKDLSNNSSTMVLFAIEKKDPSLDINSINKWNFNFIASSVPSDYMRIYSILNKDELFEIPKEPISFLQRIYFKFINLLSKLFNE